MTGTGMTLTGILVGLIVAVLIVWLAPRTPVWRRAAKAGHAGGDWPPGSEPILLRGRGACTTDTLALRAGAYRADYHFPDEWGIAVFLVSATSGDKDMLLYKSGSGSVDFTVDADERVIVQVEPTADELDWQLGLIPLAAGPPPE